MEDHPLKKSPTFLPTYVLAVTELWPASAQSVVHGAGKLSRFRVTQELGSGLVAFEDSTPHSCEPNFIFWSGWADSAQTALAAAKSKSAPNSTRGIDDLREAFGMHPFPPELEGWVPIPVAWGPCRPTPKAKIVRLVVVSQMAKGVQRAVWAPDMYDLHDLEDDQGGKHPSFGRLIAEGLKLEDALEIVEMHAQGKKFEAHIKAVGEFLSEMRAIMIDPLADGVVDVQQTMEELTAAALRDREAALSYDRDWANRQ